MNTGITTTKKNLDEKSQSLNSAESIVQHRTEEIKQHVENSKKDLKELRIELMKSAGGGGWKFPFFILFMMIVGLGGVGYNRYTKLYGKSHLP